MDIQINDKVIALKTLKTASHHETPGKVYANRGDILVVKQVHPLNRYPLRVASEHYPNSTLTVGLKEVRKLGKVIARSSTIFIEKVCIETTDYFYLWMPHHKNLLGNEEDYPLRFMSLNSAKMGAERRIKKTLIWN